MDGPGLSVGRVDVRLKRTSWPRSASPTTRQSPLDPATCSTPATDRQRRNTVACKPVCGLSFIYEEYLHRLAHQSQYQRDDGLSGHHWRSDTKRRNPGVTGDGWQCRRFNPIDPAAAAAICLAEGEKDAAILAAAGLIAFTAPRGAQSLPLADFTELSGPGQGNRTPGVPLR